MMFESVLMFLFYFLWLFLKKAQHRKTVKPIQYSRDTFVSCAKSSSGSPQAQTKFDIKNKSIVSKDEIGVNLRLILPTYANLCAREIYCLDHSEQNTFHSSVQLSRRSVEKQT